MLTWKKPLLSRIIPLSVGLLVMLNLRLFAEQSIIDDFESGTLDQWSVRCGEWEIVSPGNNSSFAVRTTGTCCCGESADKRLDHDSFVGGFGRYSFDVYLEPDWASIGHPDFHLQQFDDCNFIWVELRSSAHVSGAAQLLNVVHTDSTTTGCADYPLAVATWYSIVVERYPNGVVRVLVDGELAMEGYDTSVSQPGTVALWAHSCGMRFDNIAFDPILPPTPAPIQPSCPPSGLNSCDATLCDLCDTHVCGDACCGGGENACSCPGDCPVSCGDGCCSVIEDPCTCPEDCPGPCPIDDFESAVLDGWSVRCGEWEIVSPGNNSSFAVRTTGTCCCGESADKRLDHDSFVGGFGRYSFDVYLEPDWASIGHPDFHLQQFDDCNFIWVELRSSAHVSGAAQLLNVVHTDSTTTGCADYPLAVATWYSIVVERYPNGVVRVLVDGELAMEGYDTSVSQPGTVALWAHSCGMRFDNIAFDPILAPTPAPIQPSCPPSGLNSCDATLCSALAYPPVAPPSPHNRLKNRYISFAPNNSNTVAFKVRRRSPAPAADVGWVGTPDANGIAKIEAAPVFRVWNEVAVHGGDCEIIPVAEYEVLATADGITFSPGLTVPTIELPSGGKFWGDTVGGFDGVQWTAPNNIVNANDFIAALQKFQNLPTAPHVTVVDVQSVSSTDPCLNRVTNIADVFILLQAFQGNAYPFTTNPAACPPCP